MEFGGTCEVLEHLSVNVAKRSSDDSRNSQVPGASGSSAELQYCEIKSTKPLPVR